MGLGFGGDSRIIAGAQRGVEAHLAKEKLRKIRSASRSKQPSSAVQSAARSVLYRVQTVVEKSWNDSPGSSQRPRSNVPPTNAKTDLLTFPARGVVSPVPDRRRR